MHKKIKFALSAISSIAMIISSGLIYSQGINGSVSLNASASGNTAILVTKETYADAMVAGVISQTYNIPIFLTDPDSISQNLINQLEQDNITNIIVIGGSVVISHNVTQELRDLGFNVTRIWGVTRYQTSAYVNLFFYTNASDAVIVTRDIVNENDDAGQAYIASLAEKFAEENHYPLFITPVGTLDNEVAYALELLNVSHVYIFTLQSSSLGNITDELQSMNISFTVYTRNNVSDIINELNCTQINYVAVPANINWEDMRYLIFGTACIVPEPVNQNIAFNDTQFKEIFEKEQLNKEEKLDPIEKIFERNYDKIASVLYLKLDEVNYTCDAIGFDYPICQRLPEIEQQINYTLSLLNMTYGNIENILSELSLEDNINWELGNSTNEYYMGFNYLEISKAMKEHHEIEQEIDDYLNNINIGQRMEQNENNMYNQKSESSIESNNNMTFSGNLSMEYNYSINNNNVEMNGEGSYKIYYS